MLSKSFKNTLKTVLLENYNIVVKRICSTDHHGCEGENYYVFGSCSDISFKMFLMIHNNKNDIYLCEDYSVLFTLTINPKICHHIPIINEAIYSHPMVNELSQINNDYTLKPDVSIKLFYDSIYLMRGSALSERGHFNIVTVNGKLYATGDVCNHTENLPYFQKGNLLINVTVNDSLFGFKVDNTLLKSTREIHFEPDLELTPEHLLMFRTYAFQEYLFSLYRSYSFTMKNVNIKEIINSDYETILSYLTLAEMINI